MAKTSTAVMQVINADVPQRDYWQVVLGSTAVTQQFCTVAAAVATPMHMRQERFSAQGVLLLCAVLLLVGYTVCIIVGGHILGGSLVGSCSCLTCWLELLM
jgi:lipopolysaccharide export LptBFGC system permease protein LptF